LILLHLLSFQPSLSHQKNLSHQKKPPPLGRRYFFASGHLGLSARSRQPVPKAFVTLLLLAAFLKSAPYTGPPLMQILLRTELFVAVAMADKTEAARTEITSVRFHLMPFP
jgi:hypothetical protein